MIAAVLAESPALPLHTAGKYVAGAYVVLFALVLIYVAIMAIRMSRLERDLGELLAEVDRTGALTDRLPREARDQMPAGVADGPESGSTPAYSAEGQS